VFSYRSWSFSFCLAGRAIAASWGKRDRDHGATDQTPRVKRAAQRGGAAQARRVRKRAALIRRRDRSQSPHERPSARPPVRGTAQERDAEIFSGTEIHEGLNARETIALPGAAAAYAVSSARIALLSRSHAAHRARSRVNAAAKDPARSREALAQAAAAACRARCVRLYHVEREMPSASQGRCAGRRGPIPCALRHRSDRRRFFSRRSTSVMIAFQKKFFVLRPVQRL
jgi:hypothetical protein